MAAAHNAPMTDPAGGATETSDLDTDEPDFSELEPRLQEWLLDSGVVDGRRLVRVDDATILISKFEPGFAAGVHAVLDLLPELFDQELIIAAYDDVAATAAAAGKAPLRVDVWNDATHGMLATLSGEREVDDNRQALVRVGLVSVRALLDTLLWSGPTISDGGYTPQAGEVTAYLEATDRLDTDHDLFTRHYGTFEERQVVNYCPGAPFARRMINQAWITCTGTQPPEPPAA
jgi:hypothetical protein